MSSSLELGDGKPPVYLVTGLLVELSEIHTREEPLDDRGSLLVQMTRGLHEVSLRAALRS